MNKKTTLILLAVFLALVVVVFLKERVNFAGGYQPFKGMDIKSITIKDAQSKTITLQKKGTGWFLKSGWPAKEDLCKKMTEELRVLKLKDIISTNPERFKEFMVTPRGAVAVTVNTRDENNITFYPGKPGPSRTSIYFRLERSSTVYLVRRISRYLYVKPDKNFWRDSYFFKKGLKKAEKIEIETINDSYSVSRSSGIFEKLSKKLASFKITGIEKAPGISKDKPYMVIKYIYPDRDNEIYRIFTSGDKYLVSKEGIGEFYIIDSAPVAAIKAEAFDSSN